MNESIRENLHGYPASAHIQSHALAIQLRHTRHEIKWYELPIGKMAKIVQKEPYQECEPTYEKVFAWIEESGMRLVGPTREVYLNDPREVSPEELLTELYAPIE